MAKTVSAKLVRIPFHNALAVSHGWPVQKHIGVLFANGMLALRVGFDQVQALVLEDPTARAEVLDEDIQIPAEIYDALASAVSGQRRLNRELPGLIDTLRSPVPS